MVVRGLSLRKAATGLRVRRCSREVGRINSVQAEATAHAKVAKAGKC